LAYLTDNTYKKEQIIESEILILNSIKFNLSSVTVNDYIERYISASCSSDSTVSYLAYYLCELSLLEYQMLSFEPSKIAASSIVLSLYTLDLPCWVKIFK
jgi:cyclin A